MSGSTTTSTVTPVSVQGSFFYGTVPSIAAALDLQNSVQQASLLLTQGIPNAEAAVAAAEQAVANANYFLSGDLRGLPTSPDGLAAGAAWNNGGSIDLVTA